MASVTLAESAKLALDELVAGVIENVITVNKMYEMLPFDGIDGNALAYNRENVLGDVVVATVGDTYTSLSGGKAAATFTQVTSGLTTIMGDAEVNGLIEATRSDEGNDQAAVQIASKAKSAGRKFQDMLVNGTGINNQFTGLLGLCAAGQKVDTGTNGGALSFTFLDNLIDLVTDKDGAVDYLMMPARTIRSFKALLRALGGANINETVAMPSGAEVPSYCGIPVFRNDYIPTNQTKAASGAVCTTIFAGTFDDGSRTHGIAGLTATNAAGIQVVDVGEAQDKDEHIYRIKWYCGLANFSEKGLALADGITN
jgi:hypothetical protein